MEYFNKFRCLALLLLFGICVQSDSSCTCGRIISKTFLDAATDMINQAIMNMPTCNGVCEKCNISQKPMDCSDVWNMGHNQSGIYTIWPVTRLFEKKPLSVYCDMKTNGGGWTVIQRRGNFGRPIDYFYKEWNSYKEGFGDIEKDFWLGNDNIFALTNQGQYSVRFDLQDVALERRYALYDSFWIDDEFNNYTLHISGYSGNTGDSMVRQNYQKFSTKDRQNNKASTNCAQERKGAWWYSDCSDSNLNGLYRRGKHNDTDFNGLFWIHWKGEYESLESTEIKIRLKTYKGA